MHCPNCRHDNSATTRFCIECGAVLVESTASGGRRRVLRPWGLRSAAPPTESPAMPEIVAAVQRAAGRPFRRRVGLRFAAGFGVVVLAGTFLYPYARAFESVREPDATSASNPAPVIVTMTAVHAVRETSMASPPLVEPVPATPRIVSTKVISPPKEPAREPPRSPGGGEATAVAVTPLPDREPIVAAAPPAVVAPAPVSVPVDRWAPLRSALQRCGERSGLFERATCEEGARIAHCEGFWGEAALCPLRRSDYGQ
jgi:hypothetical protein